MGIDGQQILEIRGPSEILDILEESHLVLNGPRTSEIANRFFGQRIEVCNRTPKHFVVSYEFRNEPVYEYLQELLQKYPMCWMKNTYMGDDGSCGLWIGRIVGGKPQIQTAIWQELCAEELYMGEDFQR